MYYQPFLAIHPALQDANCVYADANTIEQGGSYLTTKKCKVGCYVTKGLNRFDRAVGRLSSVRAHSKDTKIRYPNNRSGPQCDTEQFHFDVVIIEDEPKVIMKWVD